MWNPQDQLLFPSGASSPFKSNPSNTSFEPRMQSASIDQLMQQISDPANKAQAMATLIKRHPSTPDLAIRLWEFPNAVTTLLLEVVNTYKSLEPLKLTALDSERVCLAITLFQIIAYHPQTKLQLIKAQIPVYLYPFLSMKLKETPFENLRLTSLGVIGALFMVDDKEICYSLLEAGVVLQCLHSMNYGSELSTSVAVYIILRLLKQEPGLNYFLQSKERFLALTGLFQKLLERLVKDAQPSLRLIKYILGCYICLSGSPQLSRPNTSIEIITRLHPPIFKDVAFHNYIRRVDPSIGMQIEDMYRNMYRTRS
ncbi:CCR4-NOT transcription complex subunit 9-like [Impatiens glandulifera]|uniref:CCR4-NOT transcription complex subunit 9-like n=1 Tax=Impatiens glandulifera TaxID=253017 RepID=UPI001FB0BF75|nr:CCR4-NOT transcription complex subunit 9-like [Impatiens glandulifera]